MRLPVTAKIALAIAGAMPIVPGSPMPPGASPFFTRCTSIVRRFVDAQDAIVVEIMLLDAAALQRDLAPQRGADAEDDAALDLRHDRVGVDDLAAIDGANHAPDLDLALLRHLDLGDLGKVGAHGELHRDAAAHALGKGRAPSRLLGGEIEHAEHARLLAEQ